MSELLENYYTIKNIMSEETELEMKGNSYGYTADDIAKKHGVTLEEIEKQIEIGMKIEQEHCLHNSSKDFRAKITRQISLDHLWESPVYYNLLEEMEKKFKNNLTFIFFISILLLLG